MTICQCCGKETKNPKFCSRSCAAKVANRTSPKRVRKGLCRHCGAPTISCRTFCPACIAEGRHLRSGKHLGARTLGEIAYGKGANRYSVVRENARKRVKDTPNECVVCGYDLHVQVSHLKPISDYSEDTLIDEINDVANLVKLCPNHHWELDHGFLEL